MMTVVKMMKTNEKKMKSHIILKIYVHLSAANCQFTGPNGSTGIQM